MVVVPNVSHPCQHPGESSEDRLSSSLSSVAARLMQCPAFLYLLSLFLLAHSFLDVRCRGSVSLGISINSTLHQRHRLLTHHPRLWGVFSLSFSLSFPLPTPVCAFVFCFAVYRLGRLCGCQTRCSFFRMLLHSLHLRFRSCPFLSPLFVSFFFFLTLHCWISLTLLAPVCLWRLTTRASSYPSATRN